jgi:hypothetical protein
MSTSHGSRQTCVHPCVCLDGGTKLQARGGVQAEPYVERENRRELMATKSLQSTQHARNVRFCLFLTIAWGGYSGFHLRMKATESEMLSGLSKSTLLLTGKDGISARVRQRGEVA